MTREWLEAWWAAFAHDRRLVALLFRDSAGELVGLALLYQDVLEGRLELALTRLRFVGDGSADSDSLDFVVGPGYERACAHAFLSWFERQSEADLVELNTLESDRRPHAGSCAA